jgi:AcrR family transcriptional regulator
MSQEKVHSPDTKTKILDTAERLFADEGFGVSIRNLVQEAGVNLAAIHYHFQGKDGLIKAVLERRIFPLNEERFERLDALEARFTADEALPLEEVLRTFLEPVIRQKFSSKAGFFNKMVGRVFSECNASLWSIFEQNFKSLAARFIPAFFRALPELPEREVLLRLECMVATMAHTMMEQNRFKSCSPFDAKKNETFESTLERLIAYNAAGMRVPYHSNDTNEAPKAGLNAGGDSA